MTVATAEGLERRRTARRMRESGMTWRAIGEALGVSLERARQLAVLAGWTVVGPIA